MLTRSPRHRAALALGAAALLTSALTSCGFGQSTDRPYTPAAGANHYDTTIDVLGAVIVSGSPGSGTFVASFSNNDQAEAGALATLSPSSGAELTFSEFPAVDVPRGGLVNLAEAGGLGVSGDFEAGDIVPVVVAFASGESASMNIPVVADDGDFAGLDTASTVSPTDLATPDGE